MKRVVHIITELCSGGAENMLYQLLKYYDTDKFSHEVIALMYKGENSSRVEQLGIKVHNLEIDRKNILSALFKARAICRNADLVDTWLYYGDIFGFTVAKVLLRKKLVWNIRHCNLDKAVNNSRLLRIIRINALLSRYVDGITYNSIRSMENHIKAGYKDKNSVVIPNGFEPDVFKFDMELRKRIRLELGLEKEKAVITVGRWDKQKDYYTLLKALRELEYNNTRFKMIMVGTGLDHSNRELVELIDEYGLGEKTILLGRRADIPALLSAADIYVSSSLGESFSNSIGEAMACSLACVVTDVGDSAQIVLDTGKVVRPGDYTGMAQALTEYIMKPCGERNHEARLRVINNYEISLIARCFQENLQRI